MEHEKSINPFDEVQIDTFIASQMKRIQYKQQMPDKFVLWGQPIIRSVIVAIFTTAIVLMASGIWSVLKENKNKEKPISNTIQRKK